MKAKRKTTKETAAQRRARIIGKLPSLPPLDQQREYPIEAAGAYMGVGRDAVYDMIKRGILKAVKRGKLTRITGAEIVRSRA
jgi:excisionase family DNA binding protein